MADTKVSHMGLATGHVYEHSGLTQNPNILTSVRL